MQKTLVVEDFEITKSPMLAWYQSYRVSRDERSRVWHLYDRRDYGADHPYGRVHVWTSTHADLDDLAEAILSGIEAVEADEVKLAEISEPSLTSLRDHLAGRLRESGILIEDDWEAD